MHNFIQVYAKGQNLFLLHYFVIVLFYFGFLKPDDTNLIEFYKKMFQRGKWICTLRAFEHLTKIQLIEIVFFQLIKSFIISGSNFFRLFTRSKVSIMRSIKRLKISQLIEKFDQLPKKNLWILAVDQNFNNVILSYFKLSIKCQNLQVIFGTWLKVFKLI